MAMNMRETQHFAFNANYVTALNGRPAQKAVLREYRNSRPGVLPPAAIAQPPLPGVQARLNELNRDAHKAPKHGE
jgi:hypothetical protein